MKRKIIELAKKIGIHLIGFTDEAKFLWEEKVVEARKKSGYISPFQNYTASENTDPLKVWDKTKGIISVAISYKHEIPSVENMKSRGKLARIAWGLDYHKVLQNKIKALMTEINKIEKIDYRGYVDTGPLLDRAIAHRSGIGFYGKNGFIINEEYGSFIALGHILVDKPIGKSETKINISCGNCSKCVQACPTGAIKEGRKFNPYKCISYISQKREMLSSWERKALGNHLYGCDICQEVCPYNKRAKLSTEDSFRPDLEIVFPKLEDIISLDNATFKRLYKPTAAGWRGKKQLQKNAVIIAGNVKTKENFNLLLRTVKDQRPEIRLYSLLSLMEYGVNGKRIVDKYLKGESEEFIREFRKSLI